MKNTRALYLLFAANTISGASQGILLIAIPWYFASIIGRPGLFGALYMAINVISLFWGLFAGTLVDRYDRRKIFIINSIVGAVVSGSMAVVGFSQGGVPIWAAAAAFTATILIFNIHYPNLYAFGQEITPPEFYGKITSYLEVQGQLTNAFAGAIGAVLLEGFTLDAGSPGWMGSLLPGSWTLHVEAWTLQEVLLLDAGTYLVSWFLLLFMRYERVAKRHVQSGSVWLRLRSGMTWLKEHPTVMFFGSASYVLFVTVLVTGFYLQAIYVENHLHAPVSVYAWSEMAFSLGAVMAGLLIMKIFGRIRPTIAILILYVLGSTFFFTGVSNHWLPLFYFTFFLLGTSNAGTRILRVTWLFRHVPNDTMGRVGGVFNSLNVIFRIALIGLFALPLFTGAGVIWAFAIQGVLILLAAVVLMWNDRKVQAQGHP